MVSPPIQNLSPTQNLGIPNIEPHFGLLKIILTFLDWRSPIYRFCRLGTFNFTMNMLLVRVPVERCQGCADIHLVLKLLLTRCESLQLTVKRYSATNRSYRPRYWHKVNIFEDIRLGAAKKQGGRTCNHGNCLTK